MEPSQTQTDKDRRILAVASQAISKASHGAPEAAREASTEPVKWSKHSFQIREDILKEFLDFANTLGVKKYEALEEAIADYFHKHRDVVDKIRQIKAAR